jgi:hypothetical protein
MQLWLIVPVLLVSLGAAGQQGSSGTPLGTVSSNDSEIAAASRGMSTCYFYRHRLSRGAVRKIDIYVDGVKAIKLVNGRWTSIQMPPGHHLIKPNDDQHGVEPDLESDKTYYFEVGFDHKTLFHGIHKEIRPVLKEQAVYEIKQLKPLDKEDVAWPPKVQNGPAKP